jgi:hypothetical protein
MHEFIQRIFGSRKPPARVLTPATVPAWLAERETTARAALVSDTAEPIRLIRNATAELQLIVNSIAGAEQEPDIHPKLKSIAKNSLPLFVKSMNAALAKELPEEDPEEFYNAVVECLKNCVNCARGQGRYLQVVFPEEMKMVRRGIDGIGHEMNTITGLLSRYRAEQQAIAAVQALFTAREDLKADYMKSGDRGRRIAGRIAEMTERLAAIDRELSSLSQDPRQEEVAAKRTELDSLVRDRDESARTYSALSMTASHVFRKAEKIATRKHHLPAVAALGQAIDLLSSHDLPDPDTLTGVLAAACPVALSQIEEGEISLKNKEERAVFADTSAFCTQCCAACRALSTREAACQVTQEQLAAHPLLVKHSSLGREKTQLLAMLEKERQAQRELEEWREKTQAKIPALSEELGKKIAGMEENVQFQADDQMVS